jgi:hypothetical protein
MAQQNVCSFNKYGFCKFRLNCRRQHLMEKCKKMKCDIENCSLRHPQVCRYFRDIGYCKFGEWCLFKHDGITQGSKEIKVLTEKMENIEKRISEKNKEIDSLEKIINESIEKNKVGMFEEFVKAVEIKIEVFETNLSTVKKSLAEKDSFISTLESKIEDFEELNKVQNAKIEQLVKDNEHNSKNIEYLKDKFSNLANLIPVKSVSSLKCTKCEFETQSDQGLKTHITRKHTIITNGGYPKSCELCEKQFGNAGDMKIHMRTTLLRKLNLNVKIANL